MNGRALSGLNDCAQRHALVMLCLRTGRELAWLLYHGGALDRGRIWPRGAAIGRMKCRVKKTLRRERRLRMTPTGMFVSRTGRSRDPYRRIFASTRSRLSRVADPSDYLDRRRMSARRVG